jgi:hypothetical protein
VTKQTFYRNLAKCKFNDGGKWTFLYCGISGLRYRSGSHSFCPITAVTYQKTGNYLSSFRFKQAAQKLGLSQNDAECIAWAADNPKWNKKFGESIGCSKQAFNSARKAILRATGAQAT